MNEAEWTRAFQEREALWFHEGDCRPHVVLPSGKHSDVYFNPEKVFKDGRLLNLAARELIRSLKAAGLNLEEVDVIVCPPRDCRPDPDLAWHLSGLISSMTGRACARMGIEREHGSNSHRLQHSTSFDWGRVLLVEDEIAADSMLELADVAFMDGKPLLFIAGLLNVSDAKVAYGVAQVALVHRLRHAWDEQECPLCASGSKAERPEDLVREWPEAA